MVIALLSMPVYAELTVEDMGAASLPREDANNPALQGETWQAAAQNWTELVKGKSPVGTSIGVGQEKVERTDSLGDYTGMITSAPDFQSWKAVAQPDGTNPVQRGNRIHWACPGWIYSDDGETFIPADVNIRVRSMVYNYSTMEYEYDGVVDQSTTLATTNYFRLRLNAGSDGENGTSDDMLDVQDGTLPTQSFLFGGIGAGIGAFGSGSDQQKIQNTLNYCRQKALILECRATIPYKDENGVPQEPIETLGYLYPSSCPEFSGDIEMMSENELVIHGNSSTAVYHVMKSPDLITWEHDQYASGFGSVSVTLDESSDHDRYFYRVACFDPAMSSPSPSVQKSSLQHALYELPGGDVSIVD